VAHSETELQIQQPRSSLGTWLGIVLMFGIVAAFVWTVIGALPRGNKYEEQRAQVRMEKLQTAHKEWAALETYGWVDKEKGIVRMPVQRAMELSLAELAQKKPAPAGPIAPANPPAAPGALPAGAPPQTVPDALTKPAAISGPDSQVGGQPAAAAKPATAPAGTQPGPHNPPPSPAPATPPAATAKPGGGQ
jgi:hypothetical protein